MGSTDETAAAGSDPSVLDALGLAAGPERVYRHLLGVPRAGLPELALTLDVDASDVAAWVEELLSDELCVRAGEGVAAAPPHAAVSRLFARREEELRRAADRLQSSRSRVDELLEAYLAAQRTRLTDDLDRIDSTEGVRAALRHIAGRATTSVLSIVARLPSLPALQTSLDSDRAALERGVRLRCVYPSAILGDPALASVVYAQERSGVNVRLHPSPVLRALVIDDATAVVPFDPSGEREGAWIIREPGLLAPIQHLLGSVWSSGFALEQDIGDAAYEARIREVFQLLAQGVKDEGIARRLGTSVRTVRRLVADGMETLGADSRFEAGVMAQRKGWLFEA